MYFNRNLSELFNFCIIGPKYMIMDLKDMKLAIRWLYKPKIIENNMTFKWNEPKKLSVKK